MKYCCKCKTEKAFSEFNKNKAGKFGLQTWCKICSKTHFSEHGDSRDWERKKEYMREYSITRKYGLTSSEVEEMLDRQGGKCAICKKNITMATRKIDHDHDTEEVRGLLCASCNVGLGLFQDDPDLLITAAQYAMKSKKQYDLFALLQT